LPLTILVGVAAFVLGVIGASIVSASQIGRSEGRMQFQISELRNAVTALHSVVSDLNQRVERHGSI
jgi:hypothetical protein